MLIWAAEWPRLPRLSATLPASPVQRAERLIATFRPVSAGEQQFTASILRAEMGN
jgi:hypothetical protein